MSDFTDAPDIAAPDPLFDLAPVALALEDFSAIYLLLQSWRAAGVSDIEAYLTQRPEGINEYFSRIKVLKVNQRMLDLYGAKDVQALLAAGDALFATAIGRRRLPKSRGFGMAQRPISLRRSTTPLIVNRSIFGSM